jgi:HEAT repeat protein
MRHELSTGTVEQRLRALAALAAAPEPPDAMLVGPLVECVATDEKILQRRAAEVLARVEDRAAVREALLALLRDTSEEQWGAAFALSLVSGPIREMLPVCIEAFRHDDRDRRWAAAELAVALGRQESIAAELRSAVEHGDPQQRKMTLYCVRDLGLDDPDTMGVVVTALRDAEPGVRLAALATLRTCGGSTPAAEAIARVLDGDGDAGVRRAAAVTLGAFPDAAAARAALVRAAEGGDADVQRVARGVLGRIGR